MSRGTAITLAAATLLAVLLATHLFFSGGPIRVDRIVDGDEFERAILLHFRGPRVLLAMITGAALGMAGSVSQVMLRNPLASPDIIGFGAGAAAGAAMFILLFGGISAAAPGAFVGGAVAASLVMLLAWRDGISPLSLVLIGVSLNLMFTTATGIVLELSPSVLATETTRFLTGSFASADWHSVGLMSFTLLVCGAIFTTGAFAIDRLEMGDEIATAFGLTPNSIRLTAVAGIAVIVAASVAVAGPIPFVALLAGPIARLLAGQPGTLLGLSALVGATLTITADAFAKFPVAGSFLPAGVFTALVGAPAMLALLLRLEGDRK